MLNFKNLKKSYINNNVKNLVLDNANIDSSDFDFSAIETNLKALVTK